MKKYRIKEGFYQGQEGKRDAIFVIPFDKLEEAKTIPLGAMCFDKIRCRVFKNRSADAVVDDDCRLLKVGDTFEYGPISYRVTSTNEDFLIVSCVSGGVYAGTLSLPNDIF